MRFARLGWQNVRVVCKDAKLLDIGEHKADLITM